METTVIDLRPACAELARVCAAVPAARHDGPTPCAGWTVRDLLEHVDQVARSAPERIPLEPGLPARIAALGERWADPAEWEGTGALDLPAAVWGRIALTEVVVHGWDLVVSTGQGIEFDLVTLRACLDHVAEFVPTAPVAGLWGPPAAVGAEAPLLDRILGITGRDPGLSR